MASVEVRPAAVERRLAIWTVATFTAVIGYTLFGRSFAYVRVPGVQGIPIYVGEILLAAFFLLEPHASGRRFLEGLLRRAPVSGLSWAIFTMGAYGIVLAARGYLAGHPRLLVAQELVFNVYPLYIFLGVYIASAHEENLERLLRMLAWLNGLYGLAYVIVLNRFTVLLPGTDFFLFQHPIGQGFVLLGLLAYHRRGYGIRTWGPFVLNAAVLLGIQSRASWFAFVVALLLWAVISRRVVRVLAVMVAIVLLLGTAWAMDLKVAGGRDIDEYSVQNVIGAAVAPFDEQLAQQFTPDARNFAGTARWRQSWWAGIWEAVTSDPSSFTVGFGYGFPLSSTASIQSTDPTLRTPHSWFFYALGYGGLLALAIFVWFLTSLSRLLWMAFKRTGATFGLPFLALCLATATFAPFFETPFAAIPAYIIAGMAAAPALRGKLEPPADGAVLSTR